MNEEQRTTPVVKAWLKATSDTPYDTEMGVGRVRSRVRQTRQRGRWWPLPSFQRARERSPSDRATESHLDPHPATNGHTPTVIGRTQTMFSPVKAITAGAIVFAIGGAFLIAQPFQQQTSMPGAAIDPCATPITRVTGDILWGGEEPDTQYYSSTDGVHIRDFVYLSTMAVDDDRLDGETTGAIDWDLGDGMMAGVNQGTFRIDNAEGSWEGTWTGIGGSTGSWKAVLDLTGSGSYAGLSARLFTQSGGTGPVEGSVYPTDIASCDFSNEG